MAVNTLQYQGRLFDLLALRGAIPVGEALLSQTVFGPDSSGEICTGVQMLAQRWTLEFLTILDSMPFLQGRGCDFMSLFYQGYMRSELDVCQAFLLSDLQIRAHLVAEETDAMNNEERFDHAELLSVTISTDSISLHVNVVSLAGTARAIILPIAFLPIPIIA